MSETRNEPFEDMCTMVGAMTLVWAWAENFLALSIGIIDGAGQSVHGHPEAPISLKKRLSYLRTALRDVPALEPVKQDGKVLIKLFKELVPRRHQLVHGSLWLMPEDGFESSRLAIKGWNYARDQKRVEIVDVVRFNVEIRNLSVAAAAFNRRVIEIFDTP
jgi:hypothetical protein